MKRFILFCGILGFSYTVQASSVADQLTGFKCVRSPNDDGSVCTSKDVSDVTTGFHYSQPIVMLVPDGVKQPTSAILHLHGWRGVCGDDSVSSMLKNFGFMDQMARAQALNSVIVIPRSQGHEKNFNEELVPRFNSFTKWINKEVGVTSLDWTITTHSGGYVPVGGILARESQKNPDRVKIKNVVMLDATYSTRDSYYDKWKTAADANPDLRVYTVSRPGRGNTATGAHMLKSRLGGKHVDNITDTSSHCGIVKKDLGSALDKIISAESSDPSAGRGESGNPGARAQ